MKNRIMRKIAAAGMAVFLVGMSAGSGYMERCVSLCGGGRAEERGVHRRRGQYEAKCGDGEACSERR